MPHRYAVERLGGCHILSPLDATAYVEDHDGVLVDATLTGCRTCEGEPPWLELAGPRRHLFFDPHQARAAIVTCGGLCPGINDVIRAITMVLWYRYGVRTILGLRYGYEGLVPSYGHAPIVLTPDVVEDIHQHGGTILGSSRGPQDTATMVQFLQDQDICMLFAIGGDGTQRGVLAITEEIARRHLAIAVIGIPKTIDNDIQLTQRTFGFETAVAMCMSPIKGAHIEAKGSRNGIGLVKLMGRESGFIATYATLASSDVNLVLIPEVPFSVERVMEFLEARLQRKTHAVIVVAEGAGQHLVAAEGKDASGNKKLGDVGLFLKSAIERHFRACNVPVSVKYIDPSYIIRSVPANAADSVFCFQLGEKAVHAAMSGRTAMIVSLWNGQFVHIPTRQAVQGRKLVDPHSLFWQSVLDNTGQPKDLGEM